MHSIMRRSWCADSRLTARNFPYCLAASFYARNRIKGICRMTVKLRYLRASVDAAGNGGSIAINFCGSSDAVAGSVRSW